MSDLEFGGLHVTWEAVQRALGTGPWIIFGLGIAMVLERMRPARRYPEYWSRQFWLDFGAFVVMVLWSKVSQPMKW